MPVTIKDVAKLAGVSPSTVSRVIANHPKISQATKTKVYEAMKKLNYHPNVIARSLANRKTYTLGLILPNADEDLFENPFFIQVMRGISSYAQKKGYYIMYSYCKTEEQELKTIHHFINSKWVDGIILTTTRFKDKCVADLIKINHPFVVIGRPEENHKKVLWVDNDNVSAMYHVVHTLIMKGFKKIGFIGGEHEFTVIRDRLEGYKKALEDHGLPYYPHLVKEGNPTEKQSYHAACDILKKDKPDAIVCTDDIVAFGVLNAIDEQVDKRIAVVGFNNTPMSAYKTPSLSTVDINAETLGRYASKLLIHQLESQETESSNYIVGTKYIERESTLL